MTSRRVLAIRPEPPLAAMLGSGLDLTRFELEFCTGNVEAVHRLRLHNVDVVITDPATTVSEDLALAAELKLIRPAVRIIVLAPRATHADLVEAIRSHVFACFTPPFEYAEIATMTSTALTVDNWRDGIQVVSGSDHWLTVQVSCHLMTADRLVRFMSELQSSAPGGDRDELIIAFREMLLNAMEYGAGFDPEKVITVTAAKTARAIAYHFKDPGNGFDRGEVAHAAVSSGPDAVLAAATRRREMGLRPGGFGMLIARHVADELVYNERGNEVLLIKHTS